MRYALLFAAISSAAAVRAAGVVSLPDALTAIRAVGREGAGTEAAAAGWKAVTARGADALLPTLLAFRGASPAAANWLRSAVDAVVEGERKAGRPLPADALKRFVLDTTQDPAARRIAFELFAGVDKSAADALVLSLTNDPSPDLRRDAIAARLSSAGSDPVRLGELFAAAREKEQVEEIAALLENKGPKPDITRHFGFVTEWNVLGPFDGNGGSGYGTPFPPEAGVDLLATFPGKGGPRVGWLYTQSRDKLGSIDLNKALGKHKNAVAYAYAILLAEKETPAEVRMSAANAVEIFLNGAKLYGHEEYHHGNRMDEYIGRGTLKAGRNEVLVKLCQNDQPEPWAQAWLFAARVCDPTGGPLPLKQVVRKDGADVTLVPGAVAADKEEKK